ncbi:MAG: histidine phosphatase family protein [Cyanophyceae cyanobacterium]
MVTNESCRSLTTNPQKYQPMIPNETTRVVLVRHGRSTYNELGIYQGCSDDAVLTPQGQRDAYQTGLFLQQWSAKLGESIAALYTSPLKRTQQTASEILAALSTTSLPSLRTIDTLKEIYMAAWQGLSYQYVKEHFAQDYRLWKERPDQFVLANPESKSREPCFPVLDLYEQAHRFWQEVLPRHRGQTILIVGHSGTNRALMSTVVGLSPERYHLLQQSNCGISILEFSCPTLSSGRLKALNVTAHLGETLPKLKEGKHGLRLLWSAATSHLDKFGQFLNQVDIDFVLSSDRHSQRVGDLLSSAVRLSYHDSIFMSTLFSQLLNDERPLATGLVIGEELYPLEPVLAPPQSLSVIHYPQIHVPVVQAVIPGDIL